MRQSRLGRANQIGKQKSVTFVVYHVATSLGKVPKTRMLSKSVRDGG